MKKSILAGAILGGAFFAAPSAQAYTAQSMCPQWSQSGPIIRAICYSGHNYDLTPAYIDLRTCAPGADVGNLFGKLVCVNPQNYGYPPPGPGYGYGPRPYYPGPGWHNRPRGPNWD
ncbi:MAG: hypothetical protein U1E28_03745 [Beijerinckiaceae bacterium]